MCLKTFVELCINIASVLDITVMASNVKAASICRAISDINISLNGSILRG